VQKQGFLRTPAAEAKKSLILVRLFVVDASFFLLVCNVYFVIITSSRAKGILDVGVQLLLFVIII